MSRFDTFCAVLARHYDDLFKTPDYALAARRYTPDEMARKMTSGLIDGTANKDGRGIELTCKELNIKHTYKAIKAFLTDGAA